MAEGAYQAAVAEYRAGLNALLTAAPAIAADSTDQGADLLARSQEVETTAAQYLGAGDGDVRELAALQLAAGAALDVAAATDLLASTGPPAIAGSPSGSEFERTYSALRDVLEADSALGARASLPPRPEIAAKETEAGPKVLADSATQAVDGISGDAAKIAGYAVDGLMGISGDAILGAFGETADRLLGPLYDRARGLVRLAVRHLAKAVSKLLRILGPLEGPARRWLEKKLTGVAKGNVVAFLMDQALEVPRLRKEVDGQIEAVSASPTSDTLAVAAGELRSLGARFGRHELVIKVLTKVLDKVRPAILALVGWAAAAMAAVYGLVLLYGVWVAGDFLDWYRTRDEGRLDMIAGVRSVVSLAVRSSAA